MFYFNTKLMVKKILNCCFGINFLPTQIFYKTQQSAFWMTSTCKKSQNCMCQILWQNWRYVGRWLSVRYRTLLKNNLSNPAKTFHFQCMFLWYNCFYGLSLLLTQCCFLSWISIPGDTTFRLVYLVFRNKMCFLN